MGNRKRNTSEWAVARMAAISKASVRLDKKRQEALDAELELRGLIREAMRYGITSGQLMGVTGLSSARLFQIKNEFRHAPSPASPSPSP
jgi:hypothetical protein